MADDDSNAYGDPESPSKSQHSSDESGSSDGVLVELPGNADQDSRVLRGDPDGGILVNFDGSMDDAGREETFEDASDEIADRSGGLEESMAVIEIGETTRGRFVSQDFARMTMRFEDTMAECRKYKEEREVFGREAVNLREQLRGIIRWQSMSLAGNNEAMLEVDDDDERVLSSPTPLHSLLKDCSRSIVDLKGVLNQRSYAESRVIELESTLRAKDKEIDELNLKVSESSLSSLWHAESEALKQSTDDAITRLLSSLETVTGGESTPPDDSSPRYGMIIVEKKVSSLIARHAQLLSEIHQLRECLRNVKPEFATSGATEFDSVFVVACEELINSKKNEVYLQEMIKKIEEENKRLTEQVERTTLNLEQANAEASKSKLELEQAENKFIATKEKLSLAVTKGKSLVQHRDSLKQSLAEKTSELEICMQELQQKSVGFQAMESRFKELKQALSEKTSELETCMQELQQKSEAFQSIESRVEELNQVLSEKTNELDNCMQALQQKSEVFQSMESRVEELNQVLSKKTNELDNMQELQKKSEVVQVTESTVETVEELKQVLSEKTIELEKCMQELQQRSGVGQATESTVEELKQVLSEKTSELERCMQELQQKSEVCQATESTVEELKRVLSEKTSELETCMQEVQQKSEICQATESTVEELKQVLSEKSSELETCMQELQHKSEDFQAMESSVEELKQVLSEKKSELEKCIEELQHKNDALEATKVTADELTVAESLVSSLKESQSYQEKVLHQMEEIISQVKTPEDMGLLDPAEKLSWIINQKSVADAIILEYQNIRKVISSVLLPDDILAGKLHLQVSWLLTSLNQVNDDLANMQDELRSTQLASESHEKELLETRKEIDHLKLSLAEETRARISIHDEHENLKNEHLEITEKFSIVLSEKDGLVKVLQEISGSTLDTETSVDTSTVREKCMVKMRETMRFSEVEVEQLETMQRLLYLSFQELKLSEMILEEEMIARSEISRLSSEVARLSEAAVAIKDDKDLVQKELVRVEEKFAMVREKLSMAVKKGKGLVQERDTLKTSLDEKTSSIEKLMQELQLKDSEIVEYQGRLKSLTAYQEHIQKLESDIAVFSDQRNENEQRLQNSDGRLQELVASVERVVLPIDATFHEPWDKVNWFSEYANHLVVEKDNLVQELNKLKEEASLANSKLSDALETIKSLEDELSKAKQHINFVSEEISGTKLNKESIEQELEIMKEENLQQASKLKDALSNIKSLENALSNAEKNIATLIAERDQVEAKGKQVVSELNSKLAGCMEELALVHASLENYSFDINDQLGHLQLILRDDSLLSVISKVLGKTTDGFRNMGLLIENLHVRLASKTDPLSKVTSFEGIEDLISKIAASVKATSIYSDDVPALNRISEGLQARDKFLCNIFEDYSRYLDGYITCILQSLQTTSGLIEIDESVKVDVYALQAQNQALEAKLVSLQEEIKELSSATINATQELLHEIEESGSSGYDFGKNISDLGLIMPKDVSSVAGEKVNNTSSNKIAERLLHVVRRIKMNYQKYVEGEKALLVSKTDIESRLKQAESAIQDQMVDQERISTLHRDLEALKQTCHEMKYKIENYEAKEDTLRAKEQQLYSAQHVLTALGMGNDQGHIDILIDKANQIKIPFSELQGWSEVVNISSPIEKLLYVVDNILELQHQMKILSKEKEDMELNLASYAREIDHLKEITKTNDSNYEELQSKKAELLEVTLGLEKILQRLEGYDSGYDKKSITAKMLLAMFEKATSALSLESENSRSRIQELLVKLQGKDKIIDEWSMKVKTLENSFNARTGQQEIIQERAVFETAPTTVGSDTSEIEDKGSVAKNVSSSSTSAHARTVWKSPSDHLVLNMDPEAERLIDSKEADGKGHVFKSLNASGLIPKQGKLIADRIDSIWVTGDRLLKNQPGARLGLVAYWIFLHLWLLATIL